MRFVKWALEYFIYLIVCILILSALFNSAPGGFQTLFAFGAPAALVWWREKQRNQPEQIAPPQPQNVFPSSRESGARLERSKSTKTSSPAQEAPAKAAVGVDARVSRTTELREKLFGDDSSIFDPKNSRRVESISSRANKPHAPGKSTYKDQVDQPSETPPEPPSATLPRATEQSVNAGSRIQELRDRLLGDDPPIISTPQQASIKHHGAAMPKSNSSKNIQGWVPKGQTVSVAGRDIDGMVYVGVPPRVGSSYYSEGCRAYIDPAQHVADYGGDRQGRGMPYWPGYSSIPATCRATYLDWLSRGRSDGSVNPGYMFLFFYGLERRFLQDNPSDQERHQIVNEVRRLRRLFEHNHSAQRYLGEFLDLAAISMAAGISRDDEKLKASILEDRGWDLPFSLKTVLGSIIANDSEIDSDWMYLWFVCHPETRLRTPAKRCREEFRALFRYWFDRLYPEGLKVKKPKRILQLEYRAASGEFTCSINPSTGIGGDVSIPDVSDLRSPIKKAQDIADIATEELDKFSRYLGRNPEGRGTLEAHALLPSALWDQFPSGELEELQSWAKAQLDGDGLVPALDVIQRLEGETPSKLSKRQLTDAADALARMGLGMAPDPRFSLRGPKLDEPVVIFDLGERVDQLEDVSAAYRRELFELALATFVAHSDKRLVEAEREALREKVDSTGGLTALERKRLHANLKWYLDVAPNMSWLRSRLKGSDAEHHLSLRAAVVAIAHADSIIRSEEVACIEKIYKALGIDPGLVYADLHAGDVSDGPVRVKPAEREVPGEQIPHEPENKVAPLDAARIAAIRSDTERVSSVLGDIFSTDEEAENEKMPDATQSSELEGLDQEHATLVKRLIQREHWSEGEVADLASELELMTSGAIETINEWAFENCDDALIEEYEGFELVPETAEAVLTMLKEEGNSG